MKTTRRGLRSVRRAFNKKYWDRPSPAPRYAEHVVTTYEVEQFIANIAATGFYEDQLLKLVSASPARRNDACDWVERKDAMDPAARIEFWNWAEQTAQLSLHGPLEVSEGVSASDSAGQPS